MKTKTIIAIAGFIFLVFVILLLSVKYDDGVRKCEKGCRRLEYRISKYDMQKGNCICTSPINPEDAGKWIYPSTAYIINLREKTAG